MTKRVGANWKGKILLLTGRITSMPRASHRKAGEGEAGDCRRQLAV